MKNEGYKEQNEYKIQAAFARAVAKKYGGKVIVYSDTAAHMGRTKMQIIRASYLQAGNIKQPDIFIPKKSEIYSGFFMEWKKESPYYKKQPTILKADERVKLQNEALIRLSKEGYAAVFCWDVHVGLQHLEDYLNNKVIDQKYE